MFLYNFISLQTILIVLAVLLIISILLQQKESSLGSMAGADTGNQIAQSRRGAEKGLHIFTVILFGLFLAGGLFMMAS